MEKLIKELEDKVNRTEKNLTKAVKKNEQLEEKLRATEGELQVRPAGGQKGRAFMAGLGQFLDQ